MIGAFSRLLRRRMDSDPMQQPGGAPPALMQWLQMLKQRQGQPQFHRPEGGMPMGGPGVLRSGNGPLSAFPMPGDAPPSMPPQDGMMYAGGSPGFYNQGGGMGTPKQTPPGALSGIPNPSPAKAKTPLGPRRFADQRYSMANTPRP
jgi:hypothetical protein